MKKLDYYLQNVRFAKAKSFINKGDVLLDIGSYNECMFEQFEGYISKGIGIDPSLEKTVQRTNHQMIKGFFPIDCPAIKFDVVTMLAVLEHIKPAEQIKIMEGCLTHLKPGGLIIITVPSVWVDHIIGWLQVFKILDGIATNEHYGFKPEELFTIFKPTHFELHHHSVFQFGLNNLFVFKKS